jgi:hypothetical protein
MTTLKDAQKNGKIDQFIKEREEYPKGDKKKFDKTLKKISRGKSKEVQETSDRDSSES